MSHVHLAGRRQEKFRYPGDTSEYELEFSREAAVALLEAITYAKRFTLGTDKLEPLVDIERALQACESEEAGYAHLDALAAEREAIIAERESPDPDTLVIWKIKGEDEWEVVANVYNEEREPDTLTIGTLDHCRNEYPNAIVQGGDGA